MTSQILLILVGLATIVLRADEKSLHGALFDELGETRFGLERTIAARNGQRKRISITGTRIIPTTEGASISLGNPFQQKPLSSGNLARE